MGRILRAPAALLLGIALGIAAAAGIAYAAVPNAAGVINACYDRQGDLRVIDAEAGESCDRRESPLSWNQRGPSGAASSVHETPYAPFSRPVPQGNEELAVATLELPAGTYQVVAKGVAQLNRTGSVARFTNAICVLRQGSETQDHANVLLDADDLTVDRSAIALTAVVSLAAAGSVELACRHQSFVEPAPIVEIGTPRITAVRGAAP